MPTDARKFEGLLRNDFRAFIHKVFTTLCPGQDYERSWHIEAIAYQLERVRQGEITRLIINMPPRSLKSISASVAFPAFVLGHNPTRRLTCVSYSGDLAKKHSNDFRAVLEAPWYRSVFPTARIGPYKNSETEIELTARGYRLCSIPRTRTAALYDRKSSVTNRSGTKAYFLKSLRINFNAACLFRLDWASTSRTSPSSTARQR
jgi:hypothetical protein